MNLSIAPPDLEGIVPHPVHAQRVDVLGYGARIEERPTGHFLHAAGAATPQPERSIPQHDGAEIGPAQAKPLRIGLDVEGAGRLIVDSHAVPPAGDGAEARVGLQAMDQAA